MTTERKYIRLRQVNPVEDGRGHTEYERDGIRVFGDGEDWYWTDGGPLSGPFSKKETLESLSWHLGGDKPFPVHYSRDKVVSQRCGLRGCPKQVRGPQGYCGRHRDNICDTGDPFRAVARGMLNRPDIKEIVADFYDNKMKVAELKDRYCKLYVELRRPPGDWTWEDFYSLCFDYLMLGNKID